MPGHCQMAYKPTRSTLILCVASIKNWIGVDKIRSAGFRWGGNVRREKKYMQKLHLGLNIISFNSQLAPSLQADARHFAWGCLSKFVFKMIFWGVVFNFRLCFLFHSFGVSYWKAFRVCSSRFRPLWSRLVGLSHKLLRWFPISSQLGIRFTSTAVASLLTK